MSHGLFFLRGLEREGYRLSWSPTKEGYLLNGSNDCKICTWDVSANPKKKVLDALYVYRVIFLSRILHIGS